MQLLRAGWLGEESLEGFTKKGADERRTYGYDESW
jgi:hypothetical protein